MCCSDNKCEGRRGGGRAKGIKLLTSTNNLSDNIWRKDHCQTDKFNSRDGRTSRGGRAGLLYLPRRIQIPSTKGLLFALKTNILAETTVVLTPVSVGLFS